MVVAFGLFLVTIAACRTGAPVIDTGPKPPPADGTIAGKVVTESGVAVVSRIVRAIAADGTKYESTTNSAGTYTMKVPAGKMAGGGASRRRITTSSSPARQA